jgi:hypothetical protein
MYGDPVDIEAFLARPLPARIATVGPTLRPVWFIFEEGAFWWLTETTTALARSIGRGERLVLVIDVCDLHTGEVIYVRAKGMGEILPVDRDRAMRKFARYLGPDVAIWDPRFEASLDGPTARFARLVPEKITAADVSFVVH